MKKSARRTIRIGIGGWTYEPWRGTFYPAKLAQKNELDYASRRLTSIEINGTYYGLQKPATFAKWHDETPEDFVFSLKAPRFVMNRKVLSTAGSSIEKFLASGITALGDKLGPINWQFLPTQVFDAVDFEAFLKLLPTQAGGRALRHVVEVRHPSFRVPQFTDLARRYAVAVAVAGDSDYPQIDDPTASFVYARIMGTREDEALGYSEAALDSWAARARSWAAGGGAPRDVYLYVISGYKVRNPAAAMALMSRLA